MKGTDDVSIHPLDVGRDPNNINFIRGLAAEVAARYGAELALMQRANGHSNATWVGNGIAVRIAHTPVEMAREVALVRALPRAVGHPEILGEGTIEGHGWIVSTEIRGQNLHEVWPMLTPVERETAVYQLWDRVKIVHDASPFLSALVASHGGFVPPSLNAASASACRASARLMLSSVQQARLQQVIESYFRAAPLVKQTVNHGDLALMNALWSGKVISLLDFEYAVLGPVEIDLCRLVCEACLSDEGHPVESDAGNAAVKIAARYMDPINGRELIHGTAVFDQLRDLDVWMDQDRIEGSRPGRLLVGLLGVDGGYLAPMFR